MRLWVRAALAALVVLDAHRAGGGWPSAIRHVLALSSPRGALARTRGTERARGTGHTSDPTDTHQARGTRIVHPAGTRSRLLLGRPRFAPCLSSPPPGRFEKSAPFGPSRREGGRQPATEPCQPTCRTSADKRRRRITWRTGSRRRAPVGRRPASNAPRVPPHRPPPVQPLDPHHRPSQKPPATNRMQR